MRRECSDVGTVVPRRPHPPERPSAAFAFFTKRHSAANGGLTPCPLCSEDLLGGLLDGLKGDGVAKGFEPFDEASGQAFRV